MSAVRARRGMIVAFLAGVLLPAAQLPAQVPPQPAGTTADAARSQTDAAAVEARQRFDGAVSDQLAAERGAANRTELLQRAVAGYRRVLELRPGAPAALYNVGRALRSLGDATGAEKALARAASRPGEQRAFYLQQWADLLRDQGRWNEAQRAYEDLVLLEPRLTEVHELLQGRYLGLRESEPDRLLDYLWRLVAGRQASRAADLALAALEAGWPGPYRAELLASIAASLAQRPGAPAEILGSNVVERLRRFTDDPLVGAGVAQLHFLYTSPGHYAQLFTWWRTRDDRWEDRRGVPRREAFRAVMRAIGDGYRARLQPDIAKACYRGAADMDDDPDPVALRSLASLYVEQRDLKALDDLASKYADPAGRLFRAKGQAYQEGKLEKILDYHRALGQIYGALAVTGRMGWGDTNSAATALFQLDRAHRVAQQLDQEAAERGEKKPARIDPELTLLYARGLEATGKPERGLEVRMSAARRFEQDGDSAASQKVLKGVTREKLSPDQIRILERYEKPQPERVPRQRQDDPRQRQKASAIEATPALQGAAKTATRADANLPTYTQRAARVARPVRLEVPATAGWLDTGVDLVEGQAIELTATGRWSSGGQATTGPEGDARRGPRGAMVTSAPAAALVARVGRATFTIGERFSGSSPAAGRLYVGINDAAAGVHDNHGSITVAITVR